MDVVAQGWGTDGQWVADAGYLDWILCCSAEAMGALITINNANFEENPEVASYEYKLPNGWDGSGGGTVVVKSPPSAPNGPWGAGSAVAQGAPDGDYFMSIRAHFCSSLADFPVSDEGVPLWPLLQRARATTWSRRWPVSPRATPTR